MSDDTTKIIEQTQATIAELLRSPEITTAAKWWADKLLEDIVMDAGDVMINTVATVARRGLESVSPKEVERFRLALAALLAVQCATNGWDVDNPQFGSACRAVHVDYAPEPVLVCALSFARISGGDLRLPIKTTMWINPGDVRVRAGYYAKEVKLYPVEAAT